MVIKGVLFDKDGTLIDVTGTWVPAYKQLLAEVFADRSPKEIEAKFMAAGYDPATGAFRAGSVLAQGTTRDIIDIWWPGLDAPGVAEKMQLLDIDYRELNATIIAAAHQSGYKVMTYTPNDPHAVAQLAAWGVDVIITDAIDVVSP